MSTMILGTLLSSRSTQGKPAVRSEATFSLPFFDGLPEDLKRKMKDVGKDLAEHALKQMEISPDERVVSVSCKDGRVSVKNSTVGDEMGDMLDSRSKDGSQVSEGENIHVKNSWSTKQSSDGARNRTEFNFNGFFRRSR